MVALMKRLSLSAEDKERSAAVSEIVDLVKKGGVGALKVCPSLLSYDHPASRLLAPWERMLSLCVCLSSLCALQTDSKFAYDTFTLFRRALSADLLCFYPCRLVVWETAYLSLLLRPQIRSLGRVPSRHTLL